VQHLLQRAGVRMRLLSLVDKRGRDFRHAGRRVLLDRPVRPGRGRALTLHGPDAGAPARDPAVQSCGSETRPVRGRGPGETTASARHAVRDPDRDRRGPPRPGHGPDLPALRPRRGARPCRGRAQTQQCRRNVRGAVRSASEPPIRSEDHPENDLPCLWHERHARIHGRSRRAFRRRGAPEHVALGPHDLLACQLAQSTARSLAHCGVGQESTRKSVAISVT